MTAPQDPALDAGRVATAVADGIATVTFAHPKGNSLPGALLRRLAEAIAEQGRNDAARVVVLRSEGTGPFCAGASFAELTAIRDEAGGREFFSGFARLILAIRDCPKLVLARVHGKAVGGGVGIASAADYALASREASVKLSELAVGIGPFVIGPAVQRKIGLAAFSALAIDAAGWRDAEWAAQHGLYARVYDTTAELDAGMDALARTLARSNPAAMAEMKRIFWAGTDDWDAILAERAGTSGRLVLSDFTREALAGFAERAR